MGDAVDDHFLAGDRNPVVLRQRLSHKPALKTFSKTTVGVADPSCRLHVVRAHLHLLRVGRPVALGLGCLTKSFGRRRRQSRRQHRSVLHLHDCLHVAHQRRCTVLELPDEVIHGEASCHKAPQHVHLDDETGPCLLACPFAESGLGRPRRWHEWVNELGERSSLIQTDLQEYEKLPSGPCSHARRSAECWCNQTGGSSCSAGASHWREPQKQMIHRSSKPSHLLAPLGCQSCSNQHHSKRSRSHQPNNEVQLGMVRPKVLAKCPKCSLWGGIQPQ